MVSSAVLAFLVAPRQKIVDALTGVISHQAVLPNRFCVPRLVTPGRKREKRGH